MWNGLAHSQAHVCIEHQRAAHILSCNFVHTTYHVRNLPAADIEHIWPVVAVAEHVGAAFGLVGSYWHVADD